MTPDHIVVGEGIDGLLGYLVRLVVAPVDAVVTSDGAYPPSTFMSRALVACCTKGALSRQP